MPAKAIERKYGIKTEENETKKRSKTKRRNKESNNTNKKGRLSVL
jgi:hypothetical protein